ncbi:hypothetical protein ACFLVH_05850 [Chloroflexota bacterium]
MNSEKAKYNPDRCLSFLTTALQQQSNYHNHKVTMSWLPTALYIPSVIGLGYILETRFENKALACWQYLLIFIIFALFALLVFLFVYRQFRLRAKAADRVAALIGLINDVSKANNVVEFEIEDSKIKEDQVLPEFILKKVVSGKGRNTLTKLTTDGVCYVAIIFSTIIGMLLVCI